MPKVRDVFPENFDDDMNITGGYPIGYVPNEFRPLDFHDPCAKKNKE